MTTLTLWGHYYNFTFLVKISCYYKGGCGAEGEGRVQKGGGGDGYVSGKYTSKSDYKGRRGKGGV